MGCHLPPYSLKKSSRYLLSIVILIAMILQGCGESKNNQSGDQRFEDALQSNPDSLLISASELALQDRGQYQLHLAKILSGYYFWRKHQLDTARYLLTECDGYFSNSEFQNTINHGRTLLYLSMVELRDDRTLKARIHAKQALAIFIEINDEAYASKAHNMLGGIENNLDNYEQSLEHHLEALRLLGNPESDPGLSRSILLNLSNTYLKINNFDKALTYANESLEIAKETNNVSGEINSLNTIGAIYSAIENLDSAVYYYSESGKLSLEVNNQQMYIVSQNNIANSYSNAGNHELSNEIIDKLIRNYPLSGYWTASLLSIRARNNLMQEKANQAIQDAIKALTAFDNNQVRQLHSILTKTLWQAYEIKQEPDSALKYAKTYFITSDSISSSKSNKQITDLRIGIETLDKEREISMLVAEKKLSQTRTRALIMGSVSVICAIALIFVTYRYQQRIKASRLEFQAQELSRELEKNKLLLSNLTLNIIHKNNGLNEIESQLAEISGTGKSKIKSIIKVNRSLDKDWEIFSSYFSRVHKDFYKILIERHGTFTVLEKRLAALIKINLTNKELSSLLGIEIKSINMARYRLKKKLSLSDEESLDDYLITLGE